MAIILTQGRPAYRTAEDGSFTADGEWEARLAPHRERIARAARAVGRLRAEGDGYPMRGTAFVCGPRRALTASHSVHELLTPGSAGESATLADGKRLAVLIGDRAIAVTKICFMHPYLRVALLALDEAADDIEPIPVTSAPPEDLGGKDVVLIAEVPGGQPVPWNGEGRYVHPGRFRQIGGLGHGEAPGILHDCSSTAGTSGGPLLDPSTGEAVGLHSAGTKLVANYAELLWDLARDPYVWKHEVLFRPDPRPSWLDRWATPEVPANPSVPTPPSQPGRAWTVDVVPIDFSAAEAKALERALFSTIHDIETAVNLAVDAGVTRGTFDASGSAQQVWRRILERASGKGVLRALVQSIHDDPEYGGLKAVLARVL